MAAPVRVKSLTFNGGTKVETAKADVVVLVGPNNSGKSRTLQEMFMRMSWMPGYPPVDPNCFALSEIELAKSESPDELVSWLSENRATRFDPADSLTKSRTFGAGDLVHQHAASQWQASGFLGPQIAPHLIKTLFAGERLNYLGSPGRLDVGAPPDHPMQALIGNSGLREEFATVFAQAFGLNVIVDAWGNAVRIRLSREQLQSDFEYTSSDGFPSAELVGQLANLPVIETQSDGVRSFAGILLTLMAGRYATVLLDEPEAFLHPPQARLLGRHLAQQHTDAQLFVATHSLDILLGLIESTPDNVLLVRLTREDGDHTVAQVLSPDRVRELWQDPLLRFSRTLDGLFHQGVIIGEGDSDSAFYSAVATDGAASSLVQGKHIMFTYAGSKHRIPMVTRALRHIGVPVRVIVDFDALNDSGTLRALVEGVGGEWTEEIKKARELLDSHLRGSEAKVTMASARAAIEAILDEGDEEPVTRKHASSIESVLEPETGWRAAKKSGRSAVPNGAATVALDELLKALEDVGVFVVPTGAVESFVKSVGGKGPKWLVEVVSGGHIATAEGARDFLQKIIGSLASPAAT